MRLPKFCLAAIAAAWLVFAVRPVRADPARASADTVVIVTGGAPRHAREVAINALLAATDMAGSKLVGSPFVNRGETAIVKCMADKAPWPCMTPTVRGKNVQQVAVVAVDSQPGSDGAPVLVITAQVVNADQFAPAGDKRFCEHCTDDVLARLAGELVRDLLREVAARSGRTVIAVRSVPRAAQITLDGKLVGATDQPINTYPGAHNLELALDGYQTASRTVDAGVGNTTDVFVQMTRNPPPSAQPVAPPPPPPVEDRGHAGPPRWLPPAGVALGVVAAGVGVALQASKSAPAVGEHQPSRLYSGPGIALMAGGGVVAIASALWWWHDTRATSAPTASLTDHGGVVGWMARF